jgi:hypothetical protein
MYDFLSNYAVGYFQQAVSDAAGAAANAPDDDGVDLWSDNQLPNRLILIADVGSVGTDGTLDLIVQDSPDQTTWDADFLTIPQITEAGLYLVEVFDPERYIRLNVNVTTDAVVWSALYLTFENQRRPVTQIGTALTPTYGTGRTAKVGGTIS